MSETKKTPWYQRSISAEVGAEFPPQKGRYHLVVNYGCPFAARAATARHLLGLDDAVSITATAPMYDYTEYEADGKTLKKEGHQGWVYDQNQNPGDKLVDAKDLVFGAYSTREIYEKGCPEGGEPFPDDHTVPILIDSVSKQVISSESADIVKMFWQSCRETLSSDAAKKYIQDNNIDLFPAEGSDLAKAVESTLEWLHPGVVFKVYSVGYAENQKAYEENLKEFFANVDKLEALLEKQRFVASNTTVTFADLSLAQMLVRWELAYAIQYRVAFKSIRDYKNVFAYMQDVVGLLKIHESAFVPEHIIQIYFGKRNDATRKERFVPIVPFNVLTQFSAENLKNHGRDMRKY